MGVVYKLKQEVIDFIVAQKKDVPGISCRKLAELASKRYQVKISKSSINDIIKSVQLSSPVGRRPLLENKLKRFEIPQERKKQILANFPKPELIKPTQETTITETPEIVSAPKQPQNNPAQEVSQDIIAQLIPDSIVNVVEQHPQNLPLEDFEEKIKRIREQKFLDKGKFVEEIGPAFLNVISLDIFKKKFLEELFKRHVPDIFIDDIDGKISQDLVSQSVPLSLAMDYANEMDQAFLEVTSFKLMLSDGTAIVLDAQMTSIWPENTIPKFSWPINKALTLLSNTLISNNKPMIFYFGSATPELPQSLFELISACEGSPAKAIQKISVLKDGADITTFSIIPNKKRKMMLGIFSWHNEFKDIIKPSKWMVKKLYYADFVDEIFYFTENRTDCVSKNVNGLNQDHRVITLWKDKETEPFLAILTNMEHESAEEIIREYIARWPNCGDAMFLSFKKIQMPKEAPSSTPGVEPWFHTRGGTGESVKDILEDYHQRLITYCATHFCPSQTQQKFMQSFLTLPGYIRESKETIDIVLKIDQTYTFKSEFEYVVKTVNEYMITNNLGQRIVCHFDMQ